jgi:chaperone modulatory protein CbpM
MKVISREQFLETCGVHVHKLEFWVQQEWLVPDESGIGFTAKEVARARLIQDLEGDFGVNAEGIDVILHLVDQLHGLRRAIEDLRADSLSQNVAGSNPPPA